MNKLNYIKRLNWRKYLRMKTGTPVKLVVAGAQKGGTTSLFKYLAHHPKVVAPLSKEIDYFNSIGSKQPTLRQYHAHFPKIDRRETDLFSIDVSPNYMIDAATVAGHIRHLNNGIKVAIILREPIQRAHSSWFMYKRYFEENPGWFMNASWVVNRRNLDQRIVRRDADFGKSFANDIADELIALENGHRIEYPIVEYGLYYQQILHFFTELGRENVLILFNRDLDTNIQESLNKITDLIGAERYMLPAERHTRHFVGTNKEPIRQSENKLLKEFYHERNSNLAHLIGQSLPWD